jgi:hypothetical protein
VRFLAMRDHSPMAVHCRSLCIGTGTHPQPNFMSRRPSEQFCTDCCFQWAEAA